MIKKQKTQVLCSSRREFLQYLRDEGLSRDDYVMWIKGCCRNRTGPFVEVGEVEEVTGKDEPDAFHFHEIVDRCHIINSMIDDFLIGGPGMDADSNRLCEEAQDLLCGVMNRVTLRGDEDEKQG